MSPTSWVICWKPSSRIWMRCVLREGRHESWSSRCMEEWLKPSPTQSWKKNGPHGGRQHHHLHLVQSCRHTHFECAAGGGRADQWNSLIRSGAISGRTFLNRLGDHRKG